MGRIVSEGGPEGIFKVRHAVLPDVIRPTGPILDNSLPMTQNAMVKQIYTSALLELLCRKEFTGIRFIT